MRKNWRKKKALKVCELKKIIHESSSQVIKSN